MMKKTINNKEYVPPTVEYYRFAVEAGFFGSLENLEEEDITDPWEEVRLNRR